MPKYLRWLLRLIGPALLVLFLATSDLEKLYTILLGAAPWPIIFSLILMPPFVIVKSWRWRYLIRSMDMQLSLGTAIGLYTVGLFWGATTPGQAGDLAKAWYLRDRGQPLAPALLTVILDRLCDLLVMAAFSIIGIFALGQWLPSRELQTVVVGLMTIGVTVLTIVLVAQRPRSWVLTRVLPAVLPRRLHESLARWNEQLSGLSLSPHLVLVIGIASLISAAFTFYRLWLLFVALEVFLPIYVVVGISALVAILQVLPISIAGFGVRDAVLIAILLPYGYSQEQALSLSALFLLLNVQHIVVGFIASFWYPLGQVTPPQPIEEGIQEAP
jgi:uncharacterized protein (TIRG00374 family)